MKTIYTLFPDITVKDPQHLLEDAVVVNGFVKKNINQVGFLLDSGEELPEELLEQVKAEICEKYHYDSVYIKTVTVGADVPLAQAIEDFCKVHSDVCNGFFCDCEAKVEGNTVTVTLHHGGLEFLYFNQIHLLVEKIVSLREKKKVICVFKEAEREEKESNHPTIEMAKSAVEPEASKPRALEPVPVLEKATQDNMIYGKPFPVAPRPIKSLQVGDKNVVVRGDIFAVELTPLRSGTKSIVSFAVGDTNGCVRVRGFFENEEAKKLEKDLKKNPYLAILGSMEFDEYRKENTIRPRAIAVQKKELRMDDSEEKRVELHLHTNMSAMDALTSATDYIKNAMRWGWDTVAITDHGVVQAFPEAFNSAKKLGFEGKILYGIEAYFVNDSAPLLFGKSKKTFAEPIVCFDIETTGLSPETEAITEIGAVLIQDGKIVKSFDTFVNPGKPIPAKIVELTGITDEMVKDAPSQAEAVKQFIEFAGDSVLVAHNANFDMSFIRAACTRNDISFRPAYLDTLTLARLLYKNEGWKNFKLDTVAEGLQVGDFNHHRACDDADVLGRILLKMLEKLEKEFQITGFENFNTSVVTACGGLSPKQQPTYHMVIFAKNKKALRNLFIMISDSHIKNYYKRPRITKSMLMQYREGLIIGSACEAGELYRGIIEGKTDAELRELVEFYDYLEIQPLANNKFLIADGQVKDEEELRNINRRILSLGRKYNRPVVATCDVHFLNPEDEFYRSVLLGSQGYADSDKPMPLYLRTTKEMLEEFSYLGEEVAHEIVIENPRKIAEMCEVFSPLPPADKLFPPKIEGSETELRECSLEKAKRIYGDPLPDWIEERLNSELMPIIDNGYSVTYIIAKRLVKHSTDNGYRVGSRGSVGSSFVAHMADITEVNALEPHYICPKCKNLERMGGNGVECGIDLPDKLCPKCGTPYVKTGFDIPFQTFLGFNADKVPDIDLNFSGEYQTQMHRYVEELLGKEQIFKAGTITALKDKLAYGAVKKYAEEKNLVLTPLETEYLALGITGVRKSTGQHPGGMMVVPSDMEIYDFSPVQFPANDEGKNSITTHFDFHSIHDNILKLDMLGHDDPTVIRFLETHTDTRVEDIPLDDPETMSLFRSADVLHYKHPSKYFDVGTIAVPEFGTEMARGMLKKTKPTTFSELVRLTGLAHGTNVWQGNVEEIIDAGIATLPECPCTRDDIMLYLISMGMDKKLSFTIMEGVRKGKGLKPEQEQAMRDANVPDWYIDCCKKIGYMFPRAHAAAYVMSAFRIAWYKVHYPIYFYAAYFTVRADDFDAEKMIYGTEIAEQNIEAIRNGEGKGTAKDKTVGTILYVCYEYYLRGFKFANIDINRSDAKDFIVLDDNTLLPPFNSIAGLGDSVGQSIVEARQQEPFDSVEDLKNRTRLSQKTIDQMRSLGILAGLPESSQITLF